MANPASLPLQERIRRKNTLQRLADLLILLLLLSLLIYRFLNLNYHGFVWHLAFLCESWFTFIWVLNMNAKWNIVDWKTHPKRLLERFQDLPAVDMFVTTADCFLEPPIITVNTVLSLLAVDYPANKLACYVSDDGCSPITFYSLIEASKFAKLWVPFCKKYGVAVRAPAIYFSTEPKISNKDSSDFLYQWHKMKEEYDELRRKIADAVQKSVPCNPDGVFGDLLNIERGNHPSIVKVIWEKNEKHENGLPYLVYVAREKRPKVPHNFKAGAMNVLTRVSGMMTNAPFILNVDCDMFANNPQIVLHAMCLLLGCNSERESGFVQSPQIFYGGLKDDPFGYEFLLLLQMILFSGLAGIQGPFYGGTGCFHRRKIIYGLPPDDDIKEVMLNSMNDTLERRFGDSTEFVESATRILLGIPEEGSRACNLSSTLEAAKVVAGCRYEQNTRWGDEVGCAYGCAAEDFYTGLRIHAMGWCSVYCTPDPPAFLGTLPSYAPDCFTQQKRWATGVLESLIGKHGPLVGTFTRKLQFRQCLGYMVLCVWALRSIPELLYSLLPAFCLLSNASFLPKVSEPAMLVPLALFVLYNLYTLQEYRSFGLSIRIWWNNQRMGRIVSASSWSFGLLSVLLQLLGLSKSSFEVTRKDENAPDSDSDSDAGLFTFNSSPLYLPGTAIVLIHLTALSVALMGVWTSNGRFVWGLLEMFCSVWVLLNFLPFVKGLFGEGSYGIPWPTIYKASALAYVFVHWCIRCGSLQKNHS